MQRVGQLRFLLHVAGSRPRARFEDLAVGLRKLLLETYVPTTSLAHESVLEWITMRQQLARYSGQGSEIKQVTLQDAYLSDPLLPSFTGSVTAPVTDEVVRWASQVGLLRKGQGSLSGVGVLLQRVDGERMGDALTAYRPGLNPYLINDQQHLGTALVWGVVMLGPDIDLLSLLIPRLPVDEVFDRTTAGDLLPEIMEELLKELRSKQGNSPQERSQAESLSKLVKALTKQRDAGRASRGVREHVVAVRLEPLVDLGLLRKRDKYKWRYELRSEVSRAFAEATPEIRNSWPQIGTLVRSMGLPLSEVHQDGEIWKHLVRGFNWARSPVGFAGLQETLLGALVSAGNDGGFFEWQIGEALIHREQQARPKEVRFNVDRYGKIKHIRLPSEFRNDSEENTPSSNIRD